MAPKRLLDVHTYSLVLPENIREKAQDGTKRFQDIDPESGKVRYAIVSHRWTPFEIKFQDFEDKDKSEVVRKELSERVSNVSENTYDSHPGYAKLARACQLAKEYELNYVWLDTCCINKAGDKDEISIAFNSMFLYYQEAVICFALLNDVSQHKEMHRDLGKGDDVATWRCKISSFEESEWFERGWTLQELLAPEQVIFYDHQWNQFGTKQSLQSQISAVTGIGKEYLENPIAMSKACIAEKMSWASRRTTTIKDDMAYCLLGIFDISLDVRYGEEERAFMRLQEEILRKQNDESIFAWHIDGQHEMSHYGLLAPWVSCFNGCNSLTISNPESYKKRKLNGIQAAQSGVQFELPMDWPDVNDGILMNSRALGRSMSYRLGLNCWIKNSDGQTIGSVFIHLSRDNKDSPWRRANAQRLEVGPYLCNSFYSVFGSETPMARAQHIPNIVNDLKTGENVGERQLAAILSSNIPPAPKPLVLSNRVPAARKVPWWQRFYRGQRAM